MSKEPNVELMREIGLIPSGTVPKHPIELFVDYPDLIDGMHEYAQKIVAEYKQRAEAAEAKLRELEMQDPVGEINVIDKTATGDVFAAYCNTPIKGMQKLGQKLYAKPFPKQEDK